MGEIMEISGLGQAGTGYASYMFVRVTKGGAPYSGPVVFTDDETNAQKKGMTDSSGQLLQSFVVPKTTSVTVSVPGYEDVRTAHGLTVASSGEAQSSQNTVNLDLPGSSIAPAGFADDYMKYLVPAGIVIVIGIIVWNKRKAILSGLSGLKDTFTGLGETLGIVKPCRKRDLKRGRAMRSQKWCLYDRRGRKVIGRHTSRTKAIKQERLIQMKKHGIKTRR